MFGIDPLATSQPRRSRAGVAVDAARERLSELLDKESQKARLLRLDVIGMHEDAPGLELCAGDDAATWADRLFARCAGGAATLQYDGKRGHWSACVPLFERELTVAFVVDESDHRRPFEALVSALEIVAAGAPPVVDLEQAPTTVCVRFSDSVGRWQAYQPCEACGGDWVNTMFDDLDHAPLARLAARRLLVADGDGHEDDDRCDTIRCLQCASR